MVNLSKKETVAQVFSCEFCKITKNNFSYRATPVAASKNCVGILILHKLLLKYQGKTNWPPPPLHPLHPEKIPSKGLALLGLNIQGMFIFAIVTRCSWLRRLVDFFMYFEISKFWFLKLKKIVTGSVFGGAQIQADINKF